MQPSWRHHPLERQFIKLSGYSLIAEIRDRFEFFDQHDHSGGVGEGNDELEGLDKLTFDAVSVTLTTAGQLARETSDGFLKVHDGTVEYSLTVRATALVEGLVELGATSALGAPGNHTH